MPDLKSSARSLAPDLFDSVGRFRIFSIDLIFELWLYDTLPAWFTFTPGPTARNGIFVVELPSSQVMKMTPEWALTNEMMRGSSAFNQSSPALMVLLFAQPLWPCMSWHWFGVMNV